MKKFDELTEKEKISRAMYGGLTAGFLLGVLSMMFFDLYSKSKS